MKLLYAIILIMTALSLAGCSSGINLISTPPGTTTLVDGNASEWDNLNSVKNENIAFGVRNDGNYIYFAMVTGDRGKIMRIMTGGLQIWLEGANSGSRLGIQYPSKPDPEKMRKTFEERRMRGEAPEGRQDRPDFLSAQSKIGILNKDELLIEEYPVDGDTYQGKVTVERDKFVYELRIPVGAALSSPAGLGAKPGEEIKIELSTGELTPPEGMGGDGPMGGPPMGGGMPPMGGGRRGMGGGPGGRPGMDFKPLNFEFNFTLL